uniref:SH2 domain-containing protein n=1 Tax=Ornithorhynchus anatinus TaxID=9258 RepID=A0A6I8NSU4_ORNAN
MQMSPALRGRGKSRGKGGLRLGRRPGGGELSFPGLSRPLRLGFSHGDWWDVVSAVTGEAYRIPSGHVARVSNRWLYEGLGRDKAEELLLLPCNRGGSFLVRESQTRRGGYSLSVRQPRAAAWDSVRHYQIRRLDNGWLYIAPRVTFPSLQALVDYYSEVGDELCCPLSEPCAPLAARHVPRKPLPPPAVVRRPAVNWKELDSRHLLSSASPPDEASPISAGLREAVTSYLALTRGALPDDALPDDALPDDPLAGGPPTRRDPLPDPRAPARGPPRPIDSCRTA